MPQEDPLVTVILPVRNEQRHIGACMESILRQDYPHDRMEVLVMDGMSTDRTPQIVQEYASRYPWIRLVQNPKRTQAAAMNLGIRLACGEYILRVDGHAEYGDDYVSKCVYYLLKTEAENVGGPVATCPGASTRMARTIAAITQNRIVVGGSAFRTSAKAQYCDTAVFGAWRKDLFEKVGLFNEVLARGEDNEFNSRIMRHGGRIFMTPAIRVRYFNQATLWGLMRQAWGNGAWHFLTVVANPRAFKFRYCAPFGFVVWLILFGLLSFLHSGFLILLLGAVIPYLLLLTVVTVQVGRREGWDLAPYVPASVFLYHLAYGLGTLVGLFRFGLFGGEHRRRAREGSRIPDPANPPRLGQHALSEAEIAELG